MRARVNSAVLPLTQLGTRAAEQFERERRERPRAKTRCRFVVITRWKSPQIVLGCGGEPV